MVSFVPLLFATALAPHASSFVTPASLSNIIAHAHDIGTHRPAAALKSSSRAHDPVDPYSDDGSRHDLPRRRAFLRTALVAPLAIASLAAPQSAVAAAERPPPIIPLQTTARRLRAVPTFAIVDGEGVPFLTYDKDSAGGFGYFFTSYTSAEYVLDDAQKAFAKAKAEAAANKEAAGDGGGAPAGSIGEDGSGEVPDAWGRARIVSLPLDVVMQLSVKKTRSIAQNGKGKEFSTFYSIIPETADLSAALRIENGQRYAERGRCPLFYVDGLTLPPATAAEDAGAGGVAEMDPVYFRIQDLKAEWQRQYPGTDLPTIKVRELNETFRAMIRPGGGRPDESVRNLVFVPIPESVERAKTSGRSYKLGQMILTK